MKGGDEAFQMPRSLIYSTPLTPFDGRACRVLAWILWEAHARSRWPMPGQDPVDTVVRHHGRDLLEGAGLGTRQGYGALRDALAQIVALQCDGIAGPLVWDCVETHGPHYDILLSATLAEHHARPLGAYALLNMQHVRRLAEPLDMAIYARACHVARARKPQFEMSVFEIARYCRTTQATSWATLRRQVLQAIARVCVATGGRLIVQGWCSGEIAGIDRLRFHVSAEREEAIPRFPPKHHAIYFDGRPAGVARLPGPPGAPPQ